MKKYLYILTMVFFVISCVGCKKEGRIDFLDSKAPAPIQISDIKEISTPGGAILTYKIPADPNLAYAEAVYEIQPGVFRQAKASYYTDSLYLVGFGDTLSHEVKVYSVGRNEKKSAPISIEVKPLTPPLRSVFSTLTLIPTFGGVQVSFQNTSNADLAIVVIVDTTGLNTWAPAATFYTAAMDGNFSARGFDTTKRKFAVYVRDRWNNKSDTLIKSLSPLFETLIPKDTWKAVHLDNDTWQGAESVYSLENLWDGVWNKSYHNSYASPNASVEPQWFTIDLGEKVILSRMKEYQMNNLFIYQGSAVKSFQIWGSNNPDQDGGWNNWILLGTFNSFKPSGLPLGQVSPEDIDYAAVNGEDFTFETPPPPVRYIRFKTLQTYSSSGQIFICELTFWGQIIK